MITADELLAGPRGRRMLLAFARDAEERLSPESHNDSFGSAVFLASYHLDPAPGVMFGPGAEEAKRTVLAPEEVARRLSEVPLPEVTTLALRSALVEAIDAARYWQEPDGNDVLVATEPVRRELRRVGEHLARSPHAAWWTTPLAEADQWSVASWGDDDAGLPGSTTAEQLLTWRDHLRASEVRAARERPVDPSANYSGEWWSTPPVQCSTRTLSDGAPAGLWFVEDSMGWERAVTRRVTARPGARVYEVDGADAWADLCRRFPLEVTAEKRHDWYRATGRSGRWVVPDWVRLAESYAGVHLTVAGYLAAAGTAIAIDTETASVIAGWAPDETHWLADTDHVDSDPVSWVLDDRRDHASWVEEARQ